MNKIKPKPIIDRDLGTKKACIAELRREIANASCMLDSGSIHTAMMMLEMACNKIRGKLPREKIVKPFKH